MALTVVEYWPDSQLVHSASPVDNLYLPATHPTHVLPLEPVKPALQMQSDCASLALGASELDRQATHVEFAVAPTAAEYVPCPQSLQAADPAAALKVPATHCEHDPPSDPVEPALQVQAVELELPAGVSESVGQSKHVESAVEPTAAEYLPCPQSLQAADPAAALKVPAAHCEHDPQIGRAND